MRILVVATEILLPDRHGGSTHVRELVHHLRDHGETLLLARRGSRGDGVAPIGRPMRRFPAALRHLDAVRNLPSALREARTFAPDVIYERCTSYGLGAMLGRGLGVPLITMVLDQRYSWLSLLQARHLIATRLDLIPAPVRHKAVQVSWGANESLFSPELPGDSVRERYGLADACVVGYSGSFKPWHGVEGLVRAAAELADRDVRYLLVGDGPRRGPAEALARRLGVADRFVFTKAVDYERVPELLAAADICVAPFEPQLHGPSRKQGFTLDPLKVFEYLALGKPTITVRAANIEALFDDAEHLLLVGPGQPPELARGIARFVDDPAFARRTARAGRARVLAHHTWGAHARQLAGLFRDLLGSSA